MKNKKVIILCVLIILSCLIGAFLFVKNDRIKKGDGDNMPDEVNDVYKIVEFINIENMKLDETYDSNILNDNNKYFMIFNYLNLKDLLSDEIACSKIDEISSMLFDEKIDIDNLLIVYKDYVYQKDGNNVVRKKIDVGPTRDYSTKAEGYTIHKNEITLKVRLTGGIKDDSLIGSKLFEYVFIKDNDSYSLKSITLKEDYRKKDDKKDENNQESVKDKDISIDMKDEQSNELPVEIKDEESVVDSTQSSGSNSLAPLDKDDGGVMEE